MRTHRPQATEPPRRQRSPELQQVALEKGPHEVRAPEQAVVVGRREVAAGKAPSQPAAVLLGSLEHRERAELDQRQPPREALGALPEQLRRRGAEEQELARRPGLVDEDAEHREEVRAELDLVDAHQAAALTGQEPLRIGQPPQVRGPLEVHPERGGGEHGPRERRLADLACPEEGDGGSDGEPTGDVAGQVAGYVIVHIEHLIFELHINRRA